MTKSYKKDIQLLMKILQNQTKIVNVIKRFECNQKNLEKDDMAFDLCAFYMAQNKLMSHSQQSMVALRVPSVLKWEITNDEPHVRRNV